ncbi:acyl-CoA dehydrogenase family protein [Parvularcula marina]|uniref:acyl-CoA dehydrogenase family protein n=1 Tax=Parvularcula marina TaxID=2292771 RepID=UPI003519B98D
MEFALSDKAQDYYDRMTAFLEEEILPAEAAYHAELTGGGDWTKWRQPETMEKLKVEARKRGLWNMFLPDPEHGAGLSVTEYASIAEVTGRSFIAPEAVNCNAPDTGNMEVLHMFGSEEQKAEWMLPLLEGKIRSGFCMTEPGVASSDATNMAATARIEGNEVVLNGRKWWTTGLGHPNCRILIFMAVTNPEADSHGRHSMVLCPIDAPGVQIERMLTVFNDYDEPFGHGEVSFNDVRLPASNVIAGPGRGFEIAQGRLGPGRIHHCMRSIGAAERALQLLCKRALEREAFGKPLAKLGGNAEKIAEVRMAIEQARLLTMKAAWLIDTHGVRGALSEISQIKVIAPRVMEMAADLAIQVHGGAGVSADFPLTQIYAGARCLRIADGPDEVHRMVVAKHEIKRQLQG